MYLRSARLRLANSADLKFLVNVNIITVSNESHLFKDTVIT